MKILGMEIPDEVAEVIVAKAKTEELFNEYLDNMKWEWRFLETNEYVLRAIKFQKKNHPKCKIAFKIEYDADGCFEIGTSGRSDSNGVIIITIYYDSSCSLKKSHDKLFKHIKKTYQIDFEEYYPTLYSERHIIDIKCKTSQHLNELIADINERIPEVIVKQMKDNIIRIQMK